jgi:Domain of unknown function (DUF4124)
MRAHRLIRNLSAAMMLPAMMLLASTSAQSQIYKWVDSKGVTHYSEKPPADSKSKSVELREATPRSGSTAAVTPASPSLKDKEMEFRKRQVLREQTEAATAQEKTRREAACKNARAQLIDQQNSRLLYNLNERGERVYLSATERDASVARYEAEVNRNCSG